MNPLPGNVVEFRAAVQIEWRNVAEARIRRLLASVPRGIRVTVAAHAGRVHN